MGVNPDQRMHEDARKLCELTADLATGLLQASILFASFAGVLWVLSYRRGSTCRASSVARGSTSASSTNPAPRSSLRNCSNVIRQ